MAIKANEISKIIRDQIKDYDSEVVVSEVGTVISAGDGIAKVHGLEKVMALELLEFPHEVYGLAFNLEEDNVGSILFGEFHQIKEGDIVKVKVLGIDDRGKIKLSMKVVNQETGEDIAKQTEAG